jgi:hypothetical protein
MRPTRRRQRSSTAPVTFQHPTVKAADDLAEAADGHDFRIKRTADSRSVWAVPETPARDLGEPLYLVGDQYTGYHWTWSDGRHIAPTNRPDDVVSAVEILFAQTRHAL